MEPNTRKPLGPFNSPACALKDCSKILAKPLGFSINACIIEGFETDSTRSYFEQR